MAGSTGIEYVDASWNPVTGCSPVSEGCRHCFARRMAQRLRGRYGYPADEPFRVTLHPDRLDQPLRWKKPRLVFVCSMGDLLHGKVPEGFIDQVFARMALADWHLFLVLTKRVHRLAEYMREEGPGPLGSYGVVDRVQAVLDGLSGVGRRLPWPLPNVWLGATVEDAASVWRLDELVRIPAAHRWVSFEPLLGRIDLRLEERPPCSHPGCYSHVSHACEGCGRIRGRVPLDWAVVGSESGPGARPMDEDWVRAIRDPCVAAGIPLFYKQRVVGGRKVSLPYLDGRQWHQIPAM